MIPRKLHFIWLGGHLPDKYVFFVNSWRQHHLGWEIRVWNDEDAQSFSMLRRDVFEGAPNWGAKSDVFRYEILYREGGVYADTDFLCIRPLDKLLSLPFFCGAVAHGDNSVNNGLIGSVAGHPMLEVLLNRLKIPEEGFTSEATFLATGPKLFSQVVYETKAKDPESVHILPFDTFHPMPNNFSKTKEPPWQKFLTENTYAVHFWEYSWQKRTFGEKLRKALLKPFPVGLKTWVKKLFTGKKS